MVRLMFVCIGRGSSVCEKERGRAHVASVNKELFVCNVLKYSRNEFVFELCLSGSNNGHHVIAGETRRRGNQNFTCCGPVRQPRYRLEKVFPGHG